MSKPEEVIKKLGFYSAVVHGVSMYPLLINQRDTVYIEKAEKFKKYDVILFRRKDGQLVMHRLLKQYGDVLVMCGDNDFIKENVHKSQVIGVMKEFSRNGKICKASNLLYKLYYRIWCFSLPTKRLLLRTHIMFSRMRNNGVSGLERILQDLESAKNEKDI